MISLIPLAKRMARGHQPGTLALLGRQCEPPCGRRTREVVGVHLGDALAELLERARGVAREARLHGFLQRGIALAHYLVHHRGLHAGSLELGEGLARVHRVELLLVAHQHHAGDAKRIGDPQQVAVCEAVVSVRVRLAATQPAAASVPDAAASAATVSEEV